MRRSQEGGRCSSSLDVTRGRGPLRAPSVPAHARPLGLRFRSTRPHDSPVERAEDGLGEPYSGHSDAATSTSRGLAQPEPRGRSTRTPRMSPATARVADAGVRAFLAYASMNLADDGSASSLTNRTIPRDDPAKPLGIRENNTSPVPARVAPTGDSRDISCTRRRRPVRGGRGPRTPWSRDRSPDHRCRAQHPQPTHWATAATRQHRVGGRDRT